MRKDRCEQEAMNRDLHPNQLPREVKGRCGRSQTITLRFGRFGLEKTCLQNSGHVQAPVCMQEALARLAWFLA